MGPWSADRWRWGPRGPLLRGRWPYFSRGDVGFIIQLVAGRRILPLFHLTSKGLLRINASAPPPLARGDFI
ncbi:protein of unknown function [Hyphomicrobium sp. 1Nfss2.1]